MWRARSAAAWCGRSRQAPREDTESRGTMSGMRALVALAVAVAALGALAACSDPTFDVHITYERLGVAEDDELPAHVATLTVSVIDAEAAGPAAGLTTAA